MIRSRDLLIFVCVALFLAVGIAVTYVSDMHMSTLLNTTVLLTRQDSATTTYTAVSSVKKVDRQANIDRLRRLLASNTQVITEDPSVEAETEISSETPTEPEVVADVVLLKKCTSFDNGVSTMQHWPLSDTTILVKNAMRSVVHVRTDDVTPSSSDATSTASSTEVAAPQIRVTTLLLMPLYPLKTGAPNCVQSEIVGVTVLGALLSNSDAQFYRFVDSGALIGYARDGFPVYGPYSGEVDSCGGYMHPEGYRYTISAKRDFILGCYVGTPQAFTL